MVVWVVAVSVTLTWWAAAALGAGWSVLRPGDPTGGTDVSVVGVSCTSPDACTVVGHYDDGDVRGLPLVERWNGVDWSIQPTPTSAAGTLNGLSCTSSTRCVAVGYDTRSGSGALGAGGGDVPLVERWDGKRWSIRRTPGTSPANVSLDAVSCAGRTCVARGMGGGLPPPFGVDSPGAPVVARWDSTSWSIEPADGWIPAGVACASPMACFLVGARTADTPDGMLTEPLAERWNGRRWSTQRPPTYRYTTDSTLGSVSCVSPRACVAVGDYQSYTTGRDSTLAERWDGTGWTIVPSPNPAGASATRLVGVSCASPLSCLAIGTYDTRALRQRPLAERWNGRRWSIIRPPTLANAANVSPTTVSCGSNTDCVVLGTYTPRGGGADHGFIERWNDRN
jgi:hypothetical protein